jgi:hypothetical protein
LSADIGLSADSRLRYAERKPPVPGVTAPPVPLLVLVPAPLPPAPPGPLVIVSSSLQAGKRAVNDATAITAVTWKSVEEGFMMSTLP